jgi:hypothetical protein
LIDNLLFKNIIKFLDVDFCCGFDVEKFDLASSDFCHGSIEKVENYNSILNSE